MKNLNNNQKLFCQYYVENGLNGTQAYMKAYKSCKNEESARRMASKLLTKVDIQEYIQTLQGKVEEKAIVKIEDIVNELAIIAFTDRTKISKSITEEIDIPEQNRKIRLPDIVLTDTDKLTEKEKKVIAGYKKTKNGMTVETYDKVKALELLGRYLGMFKDEKPVIYNNIINPYSNLSEEELRKLAGD